MTTFSEQVALARTESFRDRVQQAAIKTAIAITNEDKETLYHDERRSLARQVANAPEAHAQRFAYGVATLGTITTESSDSDLEWGLASIWNAYW